MATHKVTHLMLNCADFVSKRVLYHYDSYCDDIMRRMYMTQYDALTVTLAGDCIVTKLERIFDAIVTIMVRRLCSIFVFSNDTITALIYQIDNILTTSIVIMRFLAKIKICA